MLVSHKCMNFFSLNDNYIGLNALDFFPQLLGAKMQKLEISPEFSSHEILIKNGS